MSAVYDMDRVAIEERDHDRTQAAREEDYAMRSESIIDDLADTIMEDKVVGCDGRHWCASDFIESIRDWEIANLIQLHGDALADLRCDIRQRMTEEVKDWLRDSNEGQSIVEREMEDSDEN